MTGQQHYLKAESLIVDAYEVFDSNVKTYGNEQALAILRAAVAVAQVHATLALAATSGDSRAENGGAP